MEKSSSLKWRVWRSFHTPVCPVRVLFYLLLFYFLFLIFRYKSLLAHADGDVRNHMTIGLCFLVRERRSWKERSARDVHLRHFCWLISAPSPASKRSNAKLSGHPLPPIYSYTRNTTDIVSPGVHKHNVPRANVLPASSEFLLGTACGVNI